MRSSIVLLAAALLAAVLIVSAAPADAAEVIVFGDSWAEGSPDELQAALAADGHPFSVAGYGVGGSTAAVWASAPSALPDAYALNPDARWVWLSVGGNDVFAAHASGGSAAASNDTSIRAILDALFARFPDARAVMFAYDFVNFEQSRECITNALAVFGPVATPVINQFFLDEIDAVQRAIAADYPNVTFVPVWGTLQAAGGIPGAPNVLLPSPERYMADCIHPTSQGYRLLHDVMVGVYWGSTRPIAGCAGCATTGCVGEPVTWRHTSTGATDVVWRVDGAAAGGEAELVWTPDTAGEVAVEIAAHGLAWADTHAFAFDAVDCAAADAPDGGTDAGDASADAADAEDAGDAEDAEDAEDAPHEDTGADAPTADVATDARGDDGASADAPAPTPDAAVDAAGVGDATAGEDAGGGADRSGGGSGGCSATPPHASAWALSFLLLAFAARRRRLAPVLLTLLLAACGSDGGASGVTDDADSADVGDGSEDADASPDTDSADGEPDGRLDVRLDTATDATDATDTTTDTPVDGPADTPLDTPSDGSGGADAAPDVADAADAIDVADAADTPEDVAPRTPQEIFGSLYWDVYRPNFLANFYSEGRVTDRIDLGTAMFGDTNMFMAKALSTFLFEYQAAGLDESIGYVHEILDAFVTLDAMPANPTFGYLVADPLDGYVYRSDRGPDFETNFCQVIAPGVCWPDLATRNNEPSGDQYMHTLAALRDVVDYPGELVHDGVDLKAQARAIAARMGDYLVRMRYEMKNVFGDLVKRGPDQRPASWGFAQAVANVTGRPRADFETQWNVLGIPIPISSQRSISHTFISGTYQFTDSCVGGEAIDVGLGLEIPVSCNEFNIGLGWSLAVASLSADPTSGDYFAAVVPMDLAIAEGSAMTALYARLKFGYDDPSIDATMRLFTQAPDTPPRSDNGDPNGWCQSWRWARDFDDPERCEGRLPGSAYSGLDYMWPRAMASAYGVLPPER